MGGSGGPADRELRAMLAVVDDGFHDEPGEAMPWAVLEGLDRLIGCDVLTFCELDLVHERVPTEQP